MVCVDIFGDNVGAMAIMNNPSIASRSKPINAKFHSIQGLVRSGRFVSFIQERSTNAQIFLRRHDVVSKRFMVHRAALVNLI